MQLDNYKAYTWITTTCLKTEISGSPELPSMESMAFLYGILIFSCSASLRPQILWFFYKRKICSNSALSKSVGAIFQWHVLTLVVYISSPQPFWHQGPISWKIIFAGTGGRGMVLG